MPTNYDRSGRQMGQKRPQWPYKRRINLIDTSPPVIYENPNDYKAYENYPSLLNDRLIKRCLSCRKVMYYDEYCECLGRNVNEEMAKKGKKRPRRKVVSVLDMGSNVDSDSGGTNRNDTQLRLV